MFDAKDILIKYLEEEWAQARQSENQRATTTRYVLLITIAIQGIIVQQDFGVKSLVLVALLCAGGRSRPRFELPCQALGLGHLRG